MTNCCCGAHLVRFDLQIVALAAVLWLNVAVAQVLGVHFTLSRRSWGDGDFDRRQPQPREMIVMYLRLASGEKLACQILVVICRVKYLKYVGRDLRTKMGGPFGAAGVFLAANSQKKMQRGKVGGKGSRREKSNNPNLKCGE